MWEMPKMQEQFPAMDITLTLSPRGREDFILYPFSLREKARMRVALSFNLIPR